MDTNNVLRGFESTIRQLVLENPKTEVRQKGLVRVEQAQLKRHGNRLLSFLLSSYKLFYVLRIASFAKLGDVCKTFAALLFARTKERISVR
jgi:hypothetical protein